MNVNISKKILKNFAQWLCVSTAITVSDLEGAFCYKLCFTNGLTKERLLIPD